MSDTPYESPNAPQSANANGIMLPPAILLLLLSVITLLFESVIGYTVIIDALLFLKHYGVAEGSLRAGPFVLGFGLVFGMHVLTLIGSIRMCRLSGYRIAKAAAIVSLIPVLSPGYVLGIPIGIFALIALSRPEVKEAFRKNEQR